MSRKKSSYEEALKQLHNQSKIKATTDRAAIFKLDDKIARNVKQIKENVLIRNNFIESQRMANYQSELDKVKKQISENTNPGVKAYLLSRQNKLNFKKAISESFIP